MGKKIIIIGSLILLILTSIVYITLSGQDVKIRVDEDKSTFYILERGSWVVSGREFNLLFDGSSRMNRDVSNIIIETFYDEEIKTSIITRRTSYLRGPLLIDTYYFQGNITDKELFPIKHTVEIYNASGKF